MKTEKNIYRAAVLEVVCAFDGDIITTSNIIDSGSDPDDDAGLGNVPMGPDNWDA